MNFSFWVLILAAFLKLPALVWGDGAYMWASATLNTDIWECNPDIGSTGNCKVVYTTGLPVQASGSNINNNGVAYDPVRRDVIWAYSGSGTNDPARGLYYWRQGVNLFARFAALTSLGTFPNNAFYHNDYYYYMNFVDLSQAELYRVQIIYSSTTGLPINIGPRQAFLVTMPQPEFEVLDIALRVDDMTVYGNLFDSTTSLRILFSMSIVNLESAPLPLQTQELSRQSSGSSTLYQLAYDATYAILYGARTGPFVRYNTQTGAITTVSSTTTGSAQVNDLGGSSLRSSQNLEGSVIFGINEENNIVQYDLFAKTAQVALVTGINRGNQYANGVAYDRTRNHVFFAYTNPKDTGLDSQNGLYAWERDNSTGTAQRIATLIQIGVNPPENYPFANAAFSYDAYWYIPNEEPVLRKVPFTYSGDGQTVTGVGSSTDYPLTGIDFSNLQMGDIVINPTTSKLYGALNLDTGGLFFYINMATLSPSAANAMVTTGTNLPTLQLAYTYGYETLYAHDRLTGAWYTLTNVDTSVQLTQVPDYGTYGAVLSARDLGGGAFF